MEKQHWYHTHHTTLLPGWMPSLFGLWQFSFSIRWRSPKLTSLKTREEHGAAVALVLSAASLSTWLILRHPDCLIWLILYRMIGRAGYGVRRMSNKCYPTTLSVREKQPICINTRQITDVTKMEHPNAFINI